MSIPLNQHISLVERLGYDKGTKLLVIHADDLGLSHSENKASIKSMENGCVNSASIMVPCPWFPEIAAYARKHKGTMDFGVHLTLNSEWKYYKWSPVTSIDNVPSLVDHNGYLHSSIDRLLTHAKSEEVGLEFRNQIKKALKAGIDITHLPPPMFACQKITRIYRYLCKIGA